MEELLPIGLALVLCEGIDRSPSGKLVLSGLLNRIESDSFPVILQKLCVYAALTDIRPRCLCKLDVVDGESDVPVLSAIEFEVPQVQQAMGTGVFEVTIDLAPFALPKPGVFQVRLFTNDHLLTQRTLLVEQAR